MVSIKQFAHLLRLSHWSKAIFVLLGVFYAGLPNYLLKACLAAFVFCLIASAVYIYNDLQDKDDDRLHPYKCRRPLTCGEVSLTVALSTLTLLLIAGFSLAFFLSIKLVVLLSIYLLINLLYNHGLKKIPILDVLCIASGFMLRVLAGTIGIGLPISWWLTIAATLVSLFIALCKRCLEKQLNLKLETRMVLKQYSSEVLDFFIAVTAVFAFLTYLLYAFFARDESCYFLLTLPFAAIGLWRFSWLTMRDGDHDDPITILFKDNLSRLNLLCFFILTLLAVAI